VCYNGVGGVGALHCSRIPAQRCFVVVGSVPSFLIKRLFYPTGFERVRNLCHHRAGRPGQLAGRPLPPAHMREELGGLGPGQRVVAEREARAPAGQLPGVGPLKFKIAFWSLMAHDGGRGWEHMGHGACHRTDNIAPT
jgi:hypothetical protein